MAHPVDEDPFLAISIAPHETLTVTGGALTSDQILTIARTIKLVDEQTWRDRYGVTDFAPGSDVMPVSATASAIAEPTTVQPVG